MTEKLTTSGLEVSRDEATELMVYHLRRAAEMFECASEEKSELLRELDRQVPLDDLQKPAMLAFVEQIFQVYAENAKEYK